MKLSYIIPVFSLIFVLNSCWIQEAPKDTKREIRIVSDFLTGADSASIRDFEKTFKAKAYISVLSADTIFARVYAQKYNSGIDVLITENESLRNKLRQFGSLRKLNDQQLFSKNDRQFYSSHQLWLGISHNPLVLIKSKDSSGNCSSVNWSDWHKKDSLRVQLKLPAAHGNYFNQLNDNFPEIMDQKRRVAVGEVIYPLSRIVEIKESQDSISHLPQQSCYYFLVHNKHYISSLTTVSILKYSPNNNIADAFVKYINSASWSWASSRNQLAVNKNINPNWYIQNLKVQ